MLKMERINSSQGASQVFIRLMRRRVWILAEVVSEEATVEDEAVISEEGSVVILAVASEGAEVISEVVLEEEEVISGADSEEAVEISEAALEVEVAQEVVDTNHSIRTVRQGILKELKEQGMTKRESTSSMIKMDND
jgi:hypothetical protein